MKHIIWDGVGYHSMRECARVVGLTRHTLKYYYDKGLSSIAEIQAYCNRQCKTCGEQVPKGRIKFCSSACYEKQLTQKTAKRMRVFRKRTLPPSKINILLSLDDNGGLPRNLGSSKTVQLMAQDGYIIEVGNGYYVMTQFGIEMLDAYLGGD